MLLNWWTSCIKINGAKEASQFPDLGFIPPNQCYRKDWLHDNPQKPADQKDWKKLCFNFSMLCTHFA